MEDVWNSGSRPPGQLDTRSFVLGDLSWLRSQISALHSFEKLASEGREAVGSRHQASPGEASALFATLPRPSSSASPHPSSGSTCLLRPRTGKLLSFFDCTNNSLANPFLPSRPAVRL